MDPNFLLLLSVVALVVTMLAVYSIKNRANKRWDRIFTLSLEILSLENAIRFPNLVTVWENKRKWRGILYWYLTFPIAFTVCSFITVQIVSRFDIPSGTVAPLALFITAIGLVVWLVLYIIALAIVGLYIKRKVRLIREELSSA